MVNHYTSQTNKPNAVLTACKNSFQGWCHDNLHYHKGFPTETEIDASVALLELGRIKSIEEYTSLPWYHQLSTLGLAFDDYLHLSESELSTKKIRHLLALQSDWLRICTAIICYFPQK